MSTEVMPVADPGENERDTVVVYISIGNSDDKLTQAEWSDFCQQVDETVDDMTEMIHGRWYSATDQPYQNACWCVEVNPKFYVEIRHRLREIGSSFDQWGIAWAEAPETEFLGDHG